MKTHRTIIIIVATMLSACGGEAPKKPNISRGSLTINLNDEFTSFLNKADSLSDTTEATEKFPSLVIQSQLRVFQNFASIANQIPSKAGSGRCVMFKASQEKLKSSDIKSAALILSSGGRVVYSDSTELKAEQCQDLFRDAIPERFQKDFFELHISLYRFH